MRISDWSSDVCSSDLSTNLNKERIGRILQMHANAREDVDAVFTGDIAAGIGFKNTRTGDSLSAPGSEIVLENPEFPEPVIHVAVEPKTQYAQAKLEIGRAHVCTQLTNAHLERRPTV